MSTFQRIETRCDFCDCGGPYSEPHDFQQIDGLNFCRWCAQGEPIAWTSSGGHEVTFREAGGWDCDCGMSTDRWRVQSVRILTPPRVLAALPNFDRATAYLHTGGRIV